MKADGSQHSLKIIQLMIKALYFIHIISLLGIFQNYLIVL